jgi:hypothetical protein
LFEKEHHLRIATVLQALDAENLAAHGCLFGGGTAIVLSHAEYRESVDIDFLVSDPRGYRELRHALTGERGLSAIARVGSELTAAREIRADQYGIRTMLVVGGTEIKLEIVFESRITLESLHSGDPNSPRICGVATLTDLDMATTKLLANSDRWSDDSVFSRDLIDLAMLEPTRPLLKRAIEKASSAYGKSIERDLEKAIETLKKRPGRLDECMVSLKIESVPKALLWKRIRDLRPIKN